MPAMIIKIFFWIILGLLLYSYVGYTLLLFFAYLISKLIPIKAGNKSGFTPSVSLIIPAYNEAACIGEKMQNCSGIEYPRDKMEIIWVTDGSDDETITRLKEYKDIRVLHDQVRRGKADAINRAVSEARSEYIVLTDANSMLNPESLKELVAPFADTLTGCTAGEKRIAPSEISTASAGEGIYWRYESLVKKLESLTGSVLGAAGELFAFRKDQYKKLATDTLLDDFTISMNIAAAGFRVKYIPEAYSVELSSLSVNEEFKRKKRIATGGIQFLIRHPELLNPLRYGFLSLKYVSHKVLRWTVAPFAFPVLFILNILICTSLSAGTLFNIMLILQLVFYIAALTGALMNNFYNHKKNIVVPYYILMMNYAMIRGILSYLKGDYSVKWPKAERRSA